MNITKRDIVYSPQCNSTLAKYRMVNRHPEYGPVKMYVGTELRSTSILERDGYQLIKPGSPERRKHVEAMLAAYEEYAERRTEYREGEKAGVLNVISILKNELTNGAQSTTTGAQSAATDEEQPMSTKIVENKTFVFGTDVTGISMDRAMELVNRINGERGKLNTMKAVSVAVRARIAELDEAEQVVAKALDATYDAGSVTFEAEAMTGEYKRERMGAPKAE